MKVLAAIVFVGVMLSGCVVYAQPDVECVDQVCVYEPDVIVGDYYVGYYRPGFGFWTGFEWDPYFYAYGHRGYGHYYRGAPYGAWHGYRSGPHFHEGAVHGGGHHR